VRANTTIILLDVESIQDDTTGDRLTNLVNYRKLNGEKTNVGMNTFFSAAAANVQLDYSVNIRARMYGNQKYVVIQGKLYEVYNVGKADDQVNTRLNVRQVNDNALKEAIIDALELIQTP